MTDKRAIAGDYSDLKFIRTRGVAQIVVEVPLEQGEEVVRLFGTPIPGSNVRVAIARLNGEAEKSPQKPAEAMERRRLHDLPPVQQAALTCQREAFWTYLREEQGATEIDTEEQAAEFVRDFCQVKSRSALTRENKPGQRWAMLLSAFEAWMEAA